MISLHKIFCKEIAIPGALNTWRYNSKLLYVNESINNGKLLHVNESIRPTSIKIFVSGMWPGNFFIKVS